MSKKHRLTKRNGVYYYRRRVPPHLFLVMGKKVIQYSLKTKDLKEAVKRRTLADLEWDANFQQAVQSLKNGSTVKTSLSYVEALRIVREDLEAADKKLQIMEAKPGTITEEQFRDNQIDDQIAIQTLKNRSDPQAEFFVGPRGHELLRKHGIQLASSTEEHAQFFELVRRALLEFYRRAAARGQQDFSKPFFDNLFGPDVPSDTSAQNTTFRELCDEYFEQFVADAINTKVSKQRIDQVESRLKLIKEIIADDTMVYTIDYDHCQAFRGTLAQVPTNRTKIYPGAPLQEAIERAKKDQRSLLAYETQSGYLSTFTNVLKLAKNKNLITNVFAEELKPSAVKTANKNKRDPFSIDQIKQFFLCDYYQECAKGQGRPYENSKHAWRFWLPLICLFMGMRPKEVCQMHLTDVEITQNGTPYFHIIATEEGDNGANGNKKTTKTAASERKIPIHPELIRIGLLDFVEKNKQAGETMFLPGLKGNKYGNLASYPLKQFRDKFLPGVLTVGKKQAFYSFRHSFRDAARRIEAPPEFLKAVGGWSQGNLVSDDYGGGVEPEQILKYLSLIEYPGLDLSYLYVKED